MVKNVTEFLNELSKFSGDFPKEKYLSAYFVKLRTVEALFAH
jgi:hypothetical protein